MSKLNLPTQSIEDISQYLINMKAEIAAGEILPRREWELLELTAKISQRLPEDVMLDNLKALNEVINKYQLTDMVGSTGSASVYKEIVNNNQVQYKNFRDFIKEIHLHYFYSKGLDTEEPMPEYQRLRIHDVEDDIRDFIFMLTRFSLFTRQNFFLCLKVIMNATSNQVMES